MKKWLLKEPLKDVRKQQTIYILATAAGYIIPDYLENDGKVEINFPYLFADSEYLNKYTKNGYKDAVESGALELFTYKELIKLLKNMIKERVVGF